ncbi:MULTISPECIES: PadR family transcriptional regulator [Lachnospiraceae]|jgi:PadR family transcriptional regulator PadR|uniref:PadR family transcriptional regulator n=1 Tax=Faecalicatena acetigenes TaxID=2981790 RepID=A0ABT2TE90_9FIRM|nr:MULTISPECIES: PadR family transcriptional regulator [Lachnospiraceae]MCU6748613.1 PadR family transcriptional regulator [Faecalicatena acetigenes]RGT70398.1 PadR family transcriptional regulator [Ruminococcus sp. AF18-22]SCI54404.1 lineage-specific thermal regulator protein [uncultured Clostridium sp.]
MTFTPNAPMLDFLVLSVIAEGDTYGYQISQIIKRVSNTKDSTLYPILKRLQENQLVEAYDMQYQGRNRKYYSITDNGRRQQQALIKEWETYKAIIDDIIKGGITND